MERHRLVVLGAGISGLTAAVKLAERGLRPRVYEGHADVGGLAATIRTPEFDFDLGGHRWYSNKPEVDRFFREMVAEDLIRVKRYSRIAYRARSFFQYPIRFADVVRLLGFAFGIKAGISLIRSRLREKGPVVNAEQAYVRNFGRSIYEKFFKEYTERLWGIPCHRLDGRWVGQRSDNLTLWKVLKGFFSKPKDLEAIDEFLYPRQGYGRFCERMAERVQRLGGTVVLDRKLASWRKADSGFELEFRDASGERHAVACDRLISTIPLDSMADACAHPPPPELRPAREALRFRDFLVVALHLGQERFTPDTWLYTQGPGLDFVRLHEPKNWSADMVRRPGTTVLVLEIPCWRDDELWNRQDGDIARRARDQLHQGVHPVEGELLGYRVLRVKNVYPVYEVGYEGNRQALLDWLGRFEGLRMAGRNGLFVYDSSDQPVASGMEAAQWAATSLESQAWNEAMASVDRAKASPAG